MIIKTLLHFLFTIGIMVILFYVPVTPAVVMALLITAVITIIDFTVGAIDDKYRKAYRDSK